MIFLSYFLLGIAGLTFAIVFARLNTASHLWVERAQAITFLERVAPKDRMSGVHMEECHFDPDDLLWDRYDEEVYADAKVGERPPYTERKVAFDEWKRTQPAPTDRELCDETCMYPAVREFLDGLVTAPRHR